jgi:hypothetical protein
MTLWDVTWKVSCYHQKISGKFPEIILNRVNIQKVSV